MIGVPTALMIFVLSLLVSLVAYIWGNLAGKISKLERKVDDLDVAKCKACEPMTLQQVKDLFDARFNEFRLELYKSGVLKAAAKRKSGES